jgi:hypothetical protein
MRTVLFGPERHSEAASGEAAWRVDAVRQHDRTRQTAPDLVAQPMLRSSLFAETVDSGEIMEATNTTLEWAHKANDKLDELRSRADGWDTQLRAFAREKPLTAVLCAMLGGYALARLTTWR